MRQTTLDPAATAAIDQVVADVARRTGYDQADVAQVAPLLLAAGARGQLNATITMLETDCKAWVEAEFRGERLNERRIGAHEAVGVMVGKLKIFRSMIDRGELPSGR